MATKRYREKFLFWLDLLKDDQFAIAEQISQLKRQRRFAQTVRDGIRLVCDLRGGRIDVLRELFPWVFDLIAQSIAEEQKRQNQLIEAQLTRLERMLLEQGGIQYVNPARAQARGPKPMTTASIPAPVFDDEDAERLEITQRLDTESARNFVNSVQALVG